MKGRRRIITAVSLAAILFSAFAILNVARRPAQRPDHTAIVLRKIGHTLLTSAGDSTSLVMPILQTSPGSYLLGFQKPFSFSHDSLVKVVSNGLQQGGINEGFTVNVLKCSSRLPVFGFEVSKVDHAIIPCEGRVEPIACYTIQITLLSNPAIADLNLYYVLFALGLCVVAFVGGTYLKTGSKTNEGPVSIQELSLVASEAEGIQIGQYRLVPARRILHNETESITLSEKEATLLEVLANAKNELVTRDQLLKQIWEDQGVFTGRSLDMFVSRLRKKLRNDPTIQLMNVHGRGYRLCDVT